MGGGEEIKHDVRKLLVFGDCFRTVWFEAFFSWTPVIRLRRKQEQRSFQEPFFRCVTQAQRLSRLDRSFAKQQEHRPV